MNILIVKTSAIGDVTHTLPALEALRKKYPEAHIAWLVEEAASGLLLEHPAIDRILISRRKSWVKGLKRGEVVRVLREFRTLIKELRGTRYDILFDFQGLLKSSLFIMFCRARRKVGFAKGMEHAEGSYLFLNEKIPPVSMEMHAVEREIYLLDAVGVKTARIEYNYPVPAQARKRAEAILRKHGIDPGRPLVAINPMTTWQTKHWASRKFAVVANALRKRGVQVVFTGAIEDVKGIDEEILPHTVDAVPNLAGNTDLPTLAALYSLADIAVSTDTGPMHIAAAVGTPVIALFGPTSPARTGPYGDRHQVLSAPIACRPCFKKICPLGTTACMAGIEAGEVLEAIDRLLGLH